MQIPGMAAQTVLGKADVMTGVSIMFFMQGIGGSIWVSIAQVLFTNNLTSGLGKIQGVDVQMILQSGTTELVNLVPKEQVGEVLGAYNHALILAFKVAMACACATIVTGLTMEWRSLKGLKEGGDVVKKGDEEVGEKKVGDDDVRKSGEGKAVDVK